MCFHWQRKVCGCTSSSEPECSRPKRRRRRKKKRNRRGMATDEAEYSESEYMSYSDLTTRKNPGKTPIVPSLLMTVFCIMTTVHLLISLKLCRTKDDSTDLILIATEQESKGPLPFVTVTVVRHCLLATMAFCGMSLLASVEVLIHRRWSSLSYVLLLNIIGTTLSLLTSVLWTQFNQVFHGPSTQTWMATLYYSVTLLMAMTMLSQAPFESSQKKASNEKTYFIQGSLAVSVNNHDDARTTDTELAE